MLITRRLDPSRRQHSKYMKNTSLPQRKHPRLKNYDYGSNGYYYITINTCENRSILSRVGRGLAPAEAEIKLSPIGKIAEEQLFDLEKRFCGLKIDKYVIMPNHIHAILILESPAAGASPRPTVPDIICAFKSLTTRICNKKFNTPGRKLFQASFYDEIIENENHYLEAWQYIENNPLKYCLRKENNL